MAEGVTVTRFQQATYNFFKWRYESSVLVKTVLALVFAALTGLGALMKFYTPWTPVPITGQVFFVLSAGVVLGRYFGGLSQMFYAVLGLLVVPWFAGSNTSPVPLIEGIPGLYQGVGGIAILYGATFGYIIGFIFAAFFVGWAVDTHIRFRKYPYLTLILLAGLGIIYLLGLIWLYAWWTANVGPLGVVELLWLGALLFIPLDLVKVALVTAVGGAVLPRRSYANEIDAPRTSPS